MKETDNNGQEAPAKPELCDAADVPAIAARIAARAAAKGGQFVVAIAGAPGSGKSSLAEVLAKHLGGAVVLAMDGYHLDNAVLEARGLMARKGAPETFDVAGLAALLARLKAGEEVIAPVFDRKLDLARAGAEEISPATPIVLVEGNYLLLRETPWAALARFWDYSVMLSVPLPVLEQRLLERWRGFGFDATQAAAKANDNDLPNGTRVAEGSATPDLLVSF